MQLTYRAVVGALRVLFAVLGLRPRVVGAEHLPRTGGVVLVANHTGYLDFALLGWLGRERGRWVRFLAKSGVFETPVVGAAMRRMRHVSVVREQPAGAVREAERLLAAGEVVGVFAEGTISRSFLVKPLRSGAAAMAAATGVPIVPVVTFGGHRLLTVDGRRTLRRGIPVHIRVGEPLSVARDADPRLVTADLHARMTALLDAALADYVRDHRCPPGAWWLPSVLGGGAPSAEEAARLDDAALARLAARRAARGTLER